MNSQVSGAGEADIYSLYTARTPEAIADVPNQLHSHAIPVPRGMGFTEGNTPAKIYAPQPLDLRQSTKELINRFEELEKHSSWDRPAPQHLACLEVPSFRVEKRISPRRLSLQNILSVFKKGRKSLKDKDGMLSTYLRPTAENQDEFDNRSQSSKFCTSPTYSILSGTVLYLQRPESISNILPVWSEHECILHSTHILLSRKTAGGIPTTSVLSLSACTDARPVPLRSLTPEERALMPAMGEACSPNVFDITFEGKLPERFAVATARERSVWVDAIWEASLRANSKRPQSDGSTHASAKPLLTVDTSVAAAGLTVEDARVHAELPPIPLPKSKVLFQHTTIACHPAVEARPFSKQDPLSPTSPGTIAQKLSALPAPSPTLRVHSPSVINLSRKSVVKQRVAEMESQASAEAYSPLSVSSGFTTPMASPLRTAPTQASYSSSQSPSRVMHKPISPVFRVEQTTQSRSYSPTVTSPTSSVFSRSRSAFRMRDELREGRRRDEQATPDDEASRALSTITSDQTSHPEEANVSRMIHAAREDMKVIRTSLENAEKRGTQDSRHIDELDKEIGEIRSAMDRSEETVLGNERPGRVLDNSSTIVHQILEKLEVMGDGPNNAEIYSLLQGDCALRATQYKQQADNARYLNELNAWLDTFAKNNAAHVESIGDAVQHLCHELSGNAIQNDASGDTQPPTLLSSMRHLVTQGQMREQENASLREALGQVITLLSEDMRLNAEMRNAYTTESVMGFMDRQKQGLEQRIQTLETRLSEEIRGSRLRFIEAMKEATEINVQGHVEELKKVIVKEALHQTREATRAQKRRQELDQEVAQMLNFRANLKRRSEPADARESSTTGTAAPKPVRARPPRSIEQVPTLSPIQERPVSAFSYRSEASSRRRALPTPPPRAQFQY